jgi:UDP-D-galactose:(glucosyl)LPS alpha-1,6-D-galactosyltransferase
VEHVVNAFGHRLQERGYRVRIVEASYKEFVRGNWVDEGLDWYGIDTDSENLEEFYIKYAKFLAETEKPKLIIATKYPCMSYFARLALELLKSMNEDVSGIKIASWIHGAIGEYIRLHIGGTECLAFADVHFVISQKTKKLIESVISGAHVEYVGNPVKMKGVEHVKEWHKESRRLLFVGRLSSEKRCDIAISALALAKNTWTLDIVGDGRLGEKLEKYACGIGVGNQVSFNGWKEQPWDMDYTDVTALVVPSDTEGFCLAMLEALTRGIPVIATPTDGALDVIKPGKNGYLFEFDSAKGLAEILDAIDDGELPDIQPSACVESVQKYEYDSMLDRFVDKIEEIIS